MALQSDSSSSSSSSESWLPEVLSRVPELRRSPQSRHPIPLDWDEAFLVDDPVVIGISDHGLYSVAAPSLHSSHGKEIKKKNFLEVLRPEAPVMIWNQELGQWVEDETARG